MFWELAGNWVGAGFRKAMIELASFQKATENSTELGFQQKPKTTQSLSG